MTAAAMAEIRLQANLAAAAWYVGKAQIESGLDDKAFAAWLCRIAKDVERDK